MHQLLINKMTLSALSSLAFIGMLATSSTQVQADITRHYQDDNKVTIYHAKNDEDRKYYVNGKVFYLKDLNPEQQSQILEVEKQLKELEQKFQLQEDKLTHFAKQLEQKARVIENEVSKLERVSIKFEKDSINMQDLASIAGELSTLAAIDQALLHQKEQEMAQVEQQLSKVDLSLVDDIEQKAHQLEKILVEIAKEI